MFQVPRWPTDARRVLTARPRSETVSSEDQHQMAGPTFPTADAPLTRGGRRLATVAPETWDRLVSLVLSAGEAAVSTLGSFLPRIRKNLVVFRTKS